MRGPRHLLCGAGGHAAFQQLPQDDPYDTSQRRTRRKRVRPLTGVLGGVPPHARYRVTLDNGSGPGRRTVTCMTPQEAQFNAETVRPFNNTRYTTHATSTP